MYSSSIAKMWLPFPFSLAASALLSIIQDKYRTAEAFTNTTKLKQLGMLQKLKLKFFDFTFLTSHLKRCMGA